MILYEFVNNLDYASTSTACATIQQRSTVFTADEMVPHKLLPRLILSDPYPTPLDKSSFTMLQLSMTVPPRGTLLWGNWSKHKGPPAGPKAWQ